MPISEISWGLPAALSVIATTPAKVPVVVGEKVTLIMQFAPTATPEPQVFVCEKAPFAVMLAIVSATVPVFVGVTSCGPLVVPTNCAAKVSVVAERFTVGTPPVPLSEMI